MKLALFDFDGTISNKDSMIDFLEYSYGKANLKRTLITLSPYLLLYKLGCYSNQKAKERLLSKYFKDMPLTKFQGLALDYSVNRMPLIIKESAVKKIQWHQSQGHRVVVVSASIEAWLLPWCDKMKIELLSSQLEVYDGLVTGLLYGANCYGQQKIERIKKSYDLKKYKAIIAYGDSKGDKEMLDLADERHFKPF